MNGWKERLKGRLEAATISDILYSFGQGNFIFIKEFENMSDVGGNFAHDSSFVLFVRFLVLTVHLPFKNFPRLSTE